MNALLVGLYSLAGFLAAVLLFSAEPMIGKMVLPLFGGTPSVWNTCLLYFQLVVLFGYALAGFLPPQSQNARLVERELVSIPALLLVTAMLVGGGLMLPFGVALPPSHHAEAAVAHPLFPLIDTLARSASLPLWLAAAASPLLQRWFAGTGHPRAQDPYFLYAASNAGSLLALLAYPFVIEPNLNLKAQASLWQGGYVALAILLVGCGLTARVLSRGVTRECGETAPARTSTTIVPNRRHFATLLLVFIPSSWLMGVTTYLTTDLAPMPLLWVIPLALYLVSYIVAFAGPGSVFVRVAARTLPVLGLAVILVLSAGLVNAWWMPLHLLVFLAGAVACHGALARLRPPASQLSWFYVSIAVGGLLGGIFNAILAPLLFHRVVEYPLAIVLGCAVASGANGLASIAKGRRLLAELALPAAVFAVTALVVTDQAGLARSAPGAFAVIAASGLVVFALRSARYRPMRFALSTGAVIAASGLTQGLGGRLLHVERNFFGVARVTEDDAHTLHRLFHGSTLHGQQSLDPSLAREPSTYFTRSGPIGQVFSALDERLRQPGTRVAIVGLGAGTLATYAQTAQRWTFYEIDPAIERIARDPRYFRYLADCRAWALDIVLGDARLRLRETPDRSYRLIVLDAFSSDSLPAHLITREAIRLYRSKLADGGVLAFNLSNRYLDLDPLMGRQAADAGLTCRIAHDLDVSDEEKQAGKQPSIWAVMTADERDLGPLAADPRWRKPRVIPGARPWTDDYSDLARYLHWKSWQRNPPS
ncbi:MAG: fused MFS/spermidine synthase [Isosphaeraceae bacterium]